MFAGRQKKAPAIAEARCLTAMLKLDSTARATRAPLGYNRRRRSNTSR